MLSVDSITTHHDHHGHHHSPTSPDWDATLGVWVGEKAPSLLRLEDIPDPLYIFGYGSLIWKPGELMEDLPSYHCYALGYQRLFAQRSCDHRGTVSFPGVTLNLVEDRLLIEKGYKSEGSSSSSSSSVSFSCSTSSTSTSSSSSTTTTSNESRCEGVVWYIPRHRAEAVIADLDYRERGGYHRHFLPVYLKEDTSSHSAGSIVSALVYIGLPTNPNFYLPANPFNLYRRSIVADLIATAKGRSGPNTEYLFRLVHYLEECGVVDEYLESLALAVRLRIGPWHSRLHPPPRILEASDRDDSSVKVKAKLWGWGNNEHGQLEALSEHHPIVSYASPITNLAAAWPRHELHVAVAGGGSSGWLSGDRLFLQGHIVRHLLEKGDLDPLVAEDGEEPGNAAGIIVLEGVRGAALGYDHSLLLLHNGAVIDLNHANPQEGAPKIVQGFQLQAIEGRKRHFGFILSETTSGDDVQASDTVVKLAVGPRHCVVVTTQGNALFWGEDRYLPPTSAWRPSTEGSKVVEVGCGAQHTVLIDDHGVVYSAGSNLRGQLGRPTEDRIDRDFQPVALPSEVRFLRVTCGWSHCVARGVKSNGDLVFYAWGRRDMGQYPLHDKEEVNLDDWKPRILPSLPSGKQVVEVWCGSEFTVTVDEEGNLWGCGWNEHDNITPRKDSGDTVVSQWTVIRDGDKEQLRLQHVWEGALACGGGHVLCIA
eukprot:scaffold14945_cov179-Ochromonas_danica.AAC.1